MLLKVNFNVYDILKLKYNKRTINLLYDIF